MKVIKEIIEQYANQRVIEELEKLYKDLGEHNNYHPQLLQKIRILLTNRINYLKQKDD